MKSRSVVLHRTVLAGLLMGFFAIPAYAGFEWTPPPAAPQVESSDASGPEITPVPTDKVEVMELMPIPAIEEPAAAPIVEEIVEAEVKSVEPMSLPESVKTEELLAVQPEPEPVIEQEIAAAPIENKTLKAPTLQGRFTNTEGFGSDIPLALAMGQIVPAEFAYSFATGVNPGLKISWNGGKPWNEVLNEALAPKGLRADVDGMTVVVRTHNGRDNVSYKDFERRSEATLPPVTEDIVISEVPAKEVEMVEPRIIEEPVKEASLRGEGTAENYPRRHPGAKKNFLNSIFSSNSSDSAPPPPNMDRQVIVENYVAPSERTNDTASAERVRKYEPAAPGATLAELAAAADREAERELAIKNSPLAKQKVSYVEGERGQDDSIFPARTVSRKDEAISGPAGSFDPAKISFWQADDKQDLRNVLSEWSEKAGVEMIWDSSYNYKLPAAFSMQGTFSEAVAKIISLYGATEPRPKGRVHPNLPKGPSVLVVENYP